MHTLIGGASDYDLPGQPMADQRMFDGSAMNAAMLHVPLGTVVKVDALSAAGRSISVTVSDRGP